MNQGLDLVFQYFFTAGAGVALGLAVVGIPSMLLYKKMSSGGLRLWRR